MTATEEIGPHAFRPEIAAQVVKEFGAVKGQVEQMGPGTGTLGPAVLARLAALEQTVGWILREWDRVFQTRPPEGG